MVLPSIINSKKNSLKVNVRLDPCSTGSDVTEAAAEDLSLRGEQQTLTISGTCGSEVKKRSCRVKLEVTNIETNFRAEIDAYVLSNIKVKYKLYSGQN